MPDFQLNYTLLVQDLRPREDLLKDPEVEKDVSGNPIPKTIEITSLNGRPPLTVEFNIEKRGFTGSNSGSFKVYNLSEANFKRLYKPMIYNVSDDRGNYQSRRISFAAGYNDNVVTIWDGFVSYAATEKKGGDIITSFESNDGIPANLTLKPITYQNKTYGEIVKAEVKRFGEAYSTRKVAVTIHPKLIEAKNGVYKKKVKSFVTDSSFMKTLTNIFGDEAYVRTRDIADIIISPPREAFEKIEEPIDITDKILVTPLSNNEYIKTSLLFEPRLIFSARVSFSSAINTPLANNASNLIVNNVSHSGTIGIRSASAFTSVELFVNRLPPPVG